MLEFFIEIISYAAVTVRFLQDKRSVLSFVQLSYIGRMIRPPKRGSRKLPLAHPKEKRFNASFALSCSTIHYELRWTSY